VLEFLPNPFGLFALIFGILLTLRKLDVAHRQPSQHPNVSAKDFALWQDTAMRAYGFGVWACFLKIVADFAIGAIFERLGLGRWASEASRPAVVVGFVIGASLEVLWIGAMVVTWRKVNRAHRLAEKVGVEHPRNGAPPAEGGLTAGSQGSPSEPSA
jgi:hypothetical protein